MYILHVAAFRCILVGGLNVSISHNLKYVGTIKTVGGWRWRTAQTLYSNLFRTKEKPGGKPGWRLSGGGLAGFYCTTPMVNQETLDLRQWFLSCKKLVMVWYLEKECCKMCCSNTPLNRPLISRHPHRQLFLLYGINYYIIKSYAFRQRHPLPPAHVIITMYLIKIWTFINV